MRKVSNEFSLSKPKAPGGILFGDRPDFPELKEWPYFWQQTAYVLGGGATNFMFLALAAKEVLK